jgi:hypothetical protein
MVVASGTGAAEQKNLYTPQKNSVKIKDTYFREINMEKRTISFSPPDISELEIAEVAEALRSGW